jgi:hypothetical protein
MSRLQSGQWRCFPARSASLRALVFAVAIFLAPAVPTVAQDSQDFILPEPGTESLLMAEHPVGVGKINDMQIGMSDRDLLFSAQVTVPPDDWMGGAKIAAVKPSMKTAASLSVNAPPGQAITIYVDATDIPWPISAAITTPATKRPATVQASRISPSPAAPWWSAQP